MRRDRDKQARLIGPTLVTPLRVRLMALPRRFQTIGLPGSSSRDTGGDVMKYSGLLFALAALFVGLQSTTVAAKDGNLIVPGVRIGPISLGMSDADVYKILGDPTQTMTEGVDMGRAIQYVFPKLTVVVSRATHKVTSVITLDPGYSTAEGIKVGSSGLAVSTKLGIPPGPCEGGCNYNYPNGISLGINPDGRVRAIWIIGSRN